MVLLLQSTFSAMLQSNGSTSGSTTNGQVCGSVTLKVLTINKHAEYCHIQVLLQGVQGNGTSCNPVNKPCTGEYKLPWGMPSLGWETGSETFRRMEQVTKNQVAHLNLVV